jgi:hypothetical protein
MPEIAGKYLVTVKLQNHITLQLEEIAGSNYPLTVQPGAINPQLCFTEGVD